MKLQLRIRQGWLFLIKHTLNRVTLRLAKRPRSHFSIVCHVGRRTGRRYETPILAEPVEGGFVIELTYGPTVNWYRNVSAAGGCVLIRHRALYTIDKLEPLSTEAALACYPTVERLLLRLLRRRQFVKFLIAQPVGKGEDSLQSTSR